MRSSARRRTRAVSSSREGRRARPWASTCQFASIRADGAWRSLVSAPVWGTGGPEFKSRRPDERGSGPESSLRPASGPRAAFAPLTPARSACLQSDGAARVHLPEQTLHMTAFPIGASATVDELEADPHPLLARLREHEPVSWLPALDAWLVTRRDFALQAMRDAETFTVDDPRFSTGRVVGPSMLTRDGDEHARHRDPFARPFRLDAVRERYTAVVAEETERLIDAIEPHGRAELRRSVAGPLAVAATATALGLDSADSVQVLGWYDAIVDSVTGVAAGRPTTRAGEEAFAQPRAAIE